MNKSDPYAVVALDFEKAEEIMMSLLSDPVRANKAALFNLRYAITRNIHGFYDSVDVSLFKPRLPERSARQRHKKAKPQPNCGPQGNNRW